MSADDEDAIRILLNPERLRKMDPWQLKVYVLLDVFRRYVLGMEIKDFRASGIAISTSSIIYKLKALRMFYRPRQRQAPGGDLGPELSLSAAYPAEVRVADMGELVEALKELIDEITRGRAEVKGIEPLEVAPSGEEEALRAIEAYMQEVLEALKRGPVNLYDLLRGRERLEAVRVFLAVLFLLSDGLVLIDEGLNMRLGI